MDNEPYISIIIPVHNVEDYLCLCVGSILGQQYADYELILVNDNSTDASPGICEDYALTDPRVKVIHNPGENGGASWARNTGLASAIGKYILFIDSDDYIEEHCLRGIVERHINEGECDVTFLNAISVFPGGDQQPYFDNHKKENYYGKAHEKVLSYLAAHDPLPVCVWGKLIRRGVLSANNISFIEGIICEDVDFCLSLYMHAKTYNHIDATYYYYRQNRPGSVMNINTDKKYYSLLHIIQRWDRLANLEHNTLSRYILQVLAYQLCMLLPMYNNLPKDQKAAERKNVNELCRLLGHNPDSRVRLLHRVYKIFGLGGVLFLLTLNEKRKNIGKR